jgi:hypothetical protein
VVVAMLADDVRMAMPPWPSWYTGRDAVATFLRSRPLSIRKQWQLLTTGANGQPAVAGYLWDEQVGAFRAETISVLTLRAARIEEITAFRSPELFPRFGLPEQLPTSGLHLCRSVQLFPSTVESTARQENESDVMSEKIQRVRTPSSNDPSSTISSPTLRATNGITTQLRGPIHVDRQASIDFSRKLANAD